MNGTLNTNRFYYYKGTYRQHTSELSGRRSGGAGSQITGRADNAINPGLIWTFWIFNIVEGRNHKKFAYEICFALLGPNFLKLT